MPSCKITRTYDHVGTIACSEPVLKDGLCAWHYALRHKPCKQGSHKWEHDGTCAECGHHISERS
jgi:hypothetical protein